MSSAVAFGVPCLSQVYDVRNVLHSEPSVSDGFDGCCRACFRNCLQLEL